MGGKESPSEADVKAVLASGTSPTISSKTRANVAPKDVANASFRPPPALTVIPASPSIFSVSAEVDDAKLKSFFAAIDGKDVAELIKEGQAKLASVPSGGGGGGVGVNFEGFGFFFSTGGGGGRSSVIP